MYKKQCKSLWCGITNSSVPRCLSVTGRGRGEAEFQIQHLLHLQYTVNERRDETNQNAPIMNSESEYTASIRAWLVEGILTSTPNGPIKDFVYANTNSATRQTKSLAFKSIKLSPHARWHCKQLQYRCGVNYMRSIGILSIIIQLLVGFFCL